MPLQMVEGKGYLGVRWSAYDENEDSLVFSVYIQRETEQEWKLLQEGISEMSYAWDSANFPDGTYTARVVASDAPSNPTQEALSASRESTPFEKEHDSKSGIFSRWRGVADGFSRNPAL